MQSNDPVTKFPQLEQDFMLSMYRMAVDHYQPKLEQRTGVELGRIEVWHYSLLNQHRVQQLKKSLGLVRTLLRWRRIQHYARSGKEMDKNNAREYTAAYHRKAIYVSFSSGADHANCIAELVVHELAHALFERLGGPTYEERFKLTSEEGKHLRLINEGYATFSQKVWFRDLYPLNARPTVGYLFGERGSIYDRGFKRVRRLVREHGMEVLMEIPRRWREF